MSEKENEPDALPAGSVKSIQELPKRGPGQQMSEAERLEYGAKIADLRFSGTRSFASCAKLLNINKSTALRCFHLFTKTFGKEYLDDQAALLYEFKRDLDYTRDAHMAEFAASAKKNNGVGKSEILARSIDKQLAGISTMQSLGLLPKVKEKIELTGEKKWTLKIVRASDGRKPIDNVGSDRPTG
jgi:hypothetical protein